MELHKNYKNYEGKPHMVVEVVIEFDMPKNNFNDVQKKRWKRCIQFAGRKKFKRRMKQHSFSITDFL